MGENNVCQDDVSMDTLNILIADDHEMVRRGLKAALTERPGWTICGEAATGRQAVELAEQLKPDIIILDVMMPGLNGLEATRQIRKVLPGAEVLILTMHESEELVREVLSAGARGYVRKSDAGRTVVQAVETLSQHQQYITPGVAEGPIHPASFNPVTPRERQVLQLIAEGKSNKEVAHELGISVRTAETHRTKVMRKLNLRSASDITRYAIRNRLIEP